MSEAMKNKRTAKYTNRLEINRQAHNQTNEYKDEKQRNSVQYNTTAIL